MAPKDPLSLDPLSLSDPSAAEENEDEELEEDLFASPAQNGAATHQRTQPTSSASKSPTKQRKDGQTPLLDRDARETQLRTELAGVRRINEVIEGVLESLERARGNMNVSPN